MLQINKLERIKKSFYLQKSEKVARDLIGKLFVRKYSNGKILSAEIIETEAYLPENDLACHAAKRRTLRNAPMFEAGGILYVYFIYGNHFCANIVTETEGKGAAVLIRAARPIEGMDIMIENRGTDYIKKLCKGPGNFAKAFNLNKSDNFKEIWKVSNEIQILRYRDYTEEEIVTTTRIGIKENSELPLRFYLKDSEYISKK
jgi:DNA-3-methyladenine glycosylase